jgi:hypothetical protein
VSVTTDFVNELTVNPKVVGLLAATARFSPAYSMVYTPASANDQQNHGGPVDLYCFSSAYVGIELLGWLPQFLAAMAIMQPINAESQAEPQAKLLGGTAAYWQGNKRHELDEMLSLVADVYAPAGEAPSWWGNTSEFEALADQMGDGRDIHAVAQHNGLTVAAQFGTEPGLILLRSEGRHPQLGNGLLVIVQLQGRYSKEEAAARSALLNFEEAIRWTDFPQLGSWHSTDSGAGAVNLAHTTFIPNALARRGLAANFVYWSLARARWAQTLAERWASPTRQ